jgi:hypothetical protein
MVGRSIQRLLITSIGAAMLLVNACGSPAPSSPSWQVIQISDRPWPDLKVVKLDESEILVSIAVMGGCPNGGHDPSFTGFQTTDDALVAVITRTPDPTGTCLITKGRAFDIRLDIRSIPDSARRVVLGGQACPPDDTICNGLSVSIPIPASTSAAGPVGLSQPPKDPGGAIRACVGQIPGRRWDLAGEEGFKPSIS